MAGLLPDKEAIESARQESLALLDAELANFETPCPDIAYQVWYDRLVPLRRHFYQIIHDHNPSFPNYWLHNGHRIDHHIFGFVAPFEILRRGFLDLVRTPLQQLTCLSKYFAEHGCRFVYAALPCKKAVYPEIIYDVDKLPPVPNIIPQWRKLLRELLGGGVEVIDLLPSMEAFRKFEKSSFPVPGSETQRIETLFSFGHDISPVGADLISAEIARYLAGTTPGLNYDSGYARTVTERVEDNCVWRTEKVAPAPVDRVSGSQVGIFGNCNLQKYLRSGLDITSKLAAKLGQPVDYLGRILPFSPIWREELANIGDGAFHGKKIIVYLGFPSAAFVRSQHFPGKWATGAFPERMFRPAAHHASLE